MLALLRFWGQKSSVCVFFAWVLHLRLTVLEPSAQTEKRFFESGQGLAECWQAFPSTPPKNEKPL
ncbi:hypothetical protein B9Z37_02915 [Limnohabitans parvus II-B4]|uniref:Uncharacterized protein n=1 Tax=Limnohabitans parvus II-B4 TaxID=1293052 RepID=A0A315EC26_9BURK|nr:hypothetical protein B9Z37_02915 [Limnohabitans parvus II-B4]